MRVIALLLANIVYFSWDGMRDTVGMSVTIDQVDRCNQELLSVNYFEFQLEMASFAILWSS